MPDLSPAQKKYLACVRREKYLINLSRIFLFMVLSKAFTDLGALPRRPEQSAKIRPCPAPDRVARCKYPDDHRCRNVCGNLWLSHQSLHRLPRS